MTTTASQGQEGAASCLHCGQSCDGDFCCAGCEQVHALLRDAGLERYYELRGAEGQPVPSALRRDRKWLEPMAARLRDARDVVRLDLDVQGIHCSACVWLVEQLFTKEKGGVEVIVNPSLGRATLTVRPGFDLARFSERVEAFGYALGPARRSAASRSSALLGRLGLCTAATMNAMIFSIAIYAGLASGRFKALFDGIDFVLATIVVLAGGTVFFRAAIEGLRRRVLHLDLPIALGLAFAYSGSVWAWRAGGAPYFDTVCVFVTLMLLGRFLQERVLERNRRQLLEGEDAAQLLTRRAEGTGSELVPCASIEAGDALVVMPGDLFPVDARLEAPCECSLDWVSGEARPRTFEAGEIVPAGAFSCGATAAHAIAETSFADSALLDLLRTPLRNVESRKRDAFWQGVTRRYVATVIVLATVGFGGWWWATGSGHRALAVATALLVVTCPCAFGIATPLAYDLVQARLRRAGLFVRAADFLDRAAHVTRVVFDKTGTLTSGLLRVTNPEVLSDLDATELRALATLSAQSGHPKAAAVAAAVRRHAEPQAGATVVEDVGVGVALEQGGARWTLGKGDGADLVFAKDGRALARFDLAEDVRPDAAKEIAALERAGYEVHVLSGDAPERTRALAEACGVPAERAHGGATPDGKAEWLAAHDRNDTLMVGDGVNDLRAAYAAHCSGTPAVDRPFVAGRSDFYFVTPGLGPIRAALGLSRRLRKVVRRNLTVALAYNAIAVALALAGLMSPLLAAVLMPLSSLSTIAATVISLRRTSWTSS